MTILVTSALLGAAVAASLLVGALVASRVTLTERVAAPVTALGGGALLAAVALELVPNADQQAGRLITALGLLAGTVVFVAADAWLSRDPSTESMRRSVHAAAAGQQLDADRKEAARGESIAAGIFVDGVPESLALGLTIADHHVGRALLTGILIGNLVEAYGAVRPIIASGYSRRFAVRLIAVIGLALATATVLGATLLADVSPALVGGAQAVAAGALLAVVAIAIVPYAFEEVSWRVALAVTAGFVGGYLLSSA